MSEHQQEPKSNWTAWYVAVLVFLLLQIVVYQLITVSFQQAP